MSEEVSESGFSVYAVDENVLGERNPEKLFIDAQNFLCKAEFSQVIVRLDASSSLLGRPGSSKESDVLLLRVLVLRGETELCQGQYATAKKTTEEALAVSKNVFGAQPGLDELAIVVTIAGQLGECDYAVGRYHEARALFLKAKDMLEEAMKTTQPLAVWGTDILSLRCRILVGLARVEIDTCSYTTAFPLVREVVQVFASGERPPERVQAEAMICHGCLLMAMGNFALARSAFEKAFQLQKEVFGLIHPARAHSLLYLGRLALVLGKVEDSLRIFDRCMEIFIKFFSPKHDTVALCNFWRAQALGMAGCYEDGLDMMGSSALALKAALGEEHPIVAQALCYQGDMILAEGFPYDALEYHKQALDLHRKMFSSVDAGSSQQGSQQGGSRQCNHALVAEALTSMGANAEARGEYSEAKAFFEEAFLVRKELAALMDLEDDVYTAELRVYQAKYCSKMYQFEDANKLLSQAGTLLCKFYGEEHLKVTDCLFQLAELSHVRGRYRDAQALYSRCLTSRTALLGPDHSSTVQVLLNSAENMRVPGYYGEALTQLDALTTAIQAMGDQTMVQAKEVLLRARILTDKRDFAGVEDKYQQVFDIYQVNNISERSSLVVDAKISMGEYYRQQGRLEEASTLLTATLTDAKGIYGESHPLVGDVQLSLALLELDYGRHESARSIIANKVLPIYEAALGQKHPATIYARGLLGVSMELVEKGIGLTFIEESVSLLSSYSQFPFSADHPWMTALTRYISSTGADTARSANSLQSLHSSLDDLWSLSWLKEDVTQSNWISIEDVGEAGNRGPDTTRSEGGALRPLTGRTEGYIDDIEAASESVSVVNFDEEDVLPPPTAIPSVRPDSAWKDWELATNGLNTATSPKFRSFEITRQRQDLFPEIHEEPQPPVVLLNDADKMDDQPDKMDDQHEHERLLAAEQQAMEPAVPDAVPVAALAAAPFADAAPAPTASTADAITATTATTATAGATAAMDHTVPDAAPAATISPTTATTADVSQVDDAHEEEGEEEEEEGEEEDGEGEEEKKEAKEEEDESIPPAERKKRKALSAAQFLYERALTLYNEGIYVKARPLIGECLRIRESYLPPTDPLNMDIAFLEARNLSKMTLWTNAHDKFLDCLSARNKCYDYYSAEVADVYLAHADNLSLQGLYAEALDKYKDALIIRSRVLGKDHYSNVEVLIHQALALLPLGRYDEAKNFVDIACTVIQNTIGSQGIEMSEALYARACVYRELARYTDALEIIDIVLTIRRRVVGEEHPLVAECLLLQGKVFHDYGRLHLGRERLAHVYDLLFKLFGEGDLRVIEAEHYLALNLFEYGRYKKAIEKNEEILAIRREKMNPRKNPEIADSILQIGINQLYLAEYSSAETNMNEAKRLYVEIFDHDNDNPRVADANYWLGQLKRIIGDFDLSKHWLDESMTGIRDAYSRTHPKYLRGQFALAEWHCDRGEYDRASTMYRNVLELRKDALTSDHPAFAESVNAYAECLRRMGKPSTNAVKLLEQATTLRKSLFGDEKHVHVSLIESVNNRGMQVLSQHAVSSTDAERAAKLLSSEEQEEGEEEQEEGEEEQEEGEEGEEEKATVVDEGGEEQMEVADDVDELSGSGGDKMNSVDKDVHNASVKIAKPGASGDSITASKSQDYYDDEDENPLPNDEAARLEKALVEAAKYKRSENGLLIFPTGPFLQAYSIFESALKLAQKAFGDDSNHPIILNIKGNMGFARKQEFEAKQYFLSIIPKMERRAILLAEREAIIQAGDDPNDESIKKYVPGAAAMYDAAVALKECGYSDLHPWIVKFQTNQDTMVSATRELEKARDRVKEADKKRRMGFFDEAEVVYNEALAVQIECMNTSATADADVAYSIYGKAENARMRGQLDLSKRYYTQAIAVWRKGGSDECAGVALGMHGLGELFRIQGLLIDAKVVLEGSLQRRVALFGDADILVAESFIALANCAIDLGRFAEADMCTIKAQAILEIDPSIEPDHNAPADWLVCLARLLMAEGKWDDALAKLEEARVVRAKVFYEEHFSVAEILHHKAACKLALGKILECRKLSNNALKLRVKIFGRSSSRDVSTTGLSNDTTSFLEMMSSLYAASLIPGLGEQATKFGSVDDDYHVPNDADGLQEPPPIFVFRGKPVTPHPIIAESLLLRAEISLCHGDYNESKEYFASARGMYWTCIGSSSNIFAARIMFGEASIAKYLGLVEASMKKHSDTLSMRLELLGPSHPDCSESYIALAYLHTIYGQFIESETMLLKAMDIRKDVFGENHYKVGEVDVGLAENYRVRGYFSESAGHFDNAFTIFIDTFGDFNLPLAAVKLGQGKLARELGHFSMAYDLTEHALSMYSLILGDEHLDCIETTSALARIMAAQGNLQEASKIFNRCLTLRQKLMGKRTVDTAKSILAVAEVATDRAQYATAAQLYHRATRVLRKLLGTMDHPLVALGLSGLANNLRLEGRYPEAKKLHESALSIRRKVYSGESHPSVADSIYALSEIDLTLGNYIDAQKGFDEALAIRRMLLGSSHLAVGRSLYGLGWINYAKGRFADAKISFETAEDIWRGCVGTDHILMADIKFALSQVHRAYGAYEQSSALLDRCVAILKTSLGLSHPLIANTMQAQAEIAQLKGDYKLAKRYFLDALRVRRIVFAAEEYKYHPDVLASYRGIAENLISWGKYEDVSKRKGWADPDEDATSIASLSITLAQKQNVPSSALSGHGDEAMEILGDNEPVHTANASTAAAVDNAAGTKRATEALLPPLRQESSSGLGVNGHRKSSTGTIVSVSTTLSQVKATSTSVATGSVSGSIPTGVTGSSSGGNKKTTTENAMAEDVDDQDDTDLYDLNDDELSKLLLLGARDRTLARTGANSKPGSPGFDLSVNLASTLKLSESGPLTMGGGDVAAGGGRGSDGGGRGSDEGGRGSDGGGRGSDGRGRGSDTGGRGSDGGGEGSDGGGRGSDGGGRGSDAGGRGSGFMSADLAGLDPLQQGSVITAESEADTDQDQDQDDESVVVSPDAFDSLYALPLLRRVIKRQSELLGEEHPVVLDSRALLADTMRLNGDYDNAAQIQKDVLMIRTRILGEEHYDSVVSMCLLADVLRALFVLYKPKSRAATKAKDGSSKKDSRDGPSLLDHLSSILGPLVPKDKKAPEHWLPQDSIRLATLQIFGSETKQVIAIMTPNREKNKSVAIEARDGYMGYSFPKKLPMPRKNVIGIANPAKIEYLDAFWLYTNAQTVFGKIFGSEIDHPLLAKILYGKGELFRLRRQIEKAVKLLDQSLSMRQRIFRATHPSIAESLNAVAEILRAQNLFQKAAPLYSKSLELRRSVFGSEDHPLVAEVQNNMALLKYAQGRFTEAFELYLSSLTIRERMLGPMHPAVAQSLNNLASLLHTMGNLDQALPLYRRSIRIKRMIFGDKHPDFASTLNNMALLLRAQGDLENAKISHEHALRIQRATLGPEHPDVACSLNNLAALYAQRKQYSEARDMYRQAAELKRKIHGIDHPAVAATLNNLASLLLLLSEPDDAKELYEEALRIRRKAFGDDHPSVAEVYNNIGHVLRSLGEFSAAAAVFEKALKSKLLSFGPEHLVTATAMANLGGIYHQLSRFDEAQRLYEHALNIRSATLGSFHNDTVDLEEALQQLLSDKEQGFITGVPGARGAPMQPSLVEQPSLFGSASLNSIGTRSPSKTLSVERITKAHTKALENVKNNLHPQSIKAKPAPKMRHHRDQASNALVKVMPPPAILTSVQGYGRHGNGHGSGPHGTGNGSTSSKSPSYGKSHGHSFAVGNSITGGGAAVVSNKRQLPPLHNYIHSPPPPGGFVGSSTTTSNTSLGPSSPQSSKHRFKAAPAAPAAGGGGAVVAVRKGSDDTCSVSAIGGIPDMEEPSLWEA